MTSLSEYVGLCMCMWCLRMRKTHILGTKRKKQTQSCDGTKPMNNTVIENAVQRRIQRRIRVCTLCVCVCAVFSSIEVNNKSKTKQLQQKIVFHSIRIFNVDKMKSARGGFHFWLNELQIQATTTTKSFSFNRDNREGTVAVFVH